MPGDMADGVPGEMSTICFCLNGKPVTLTGASPLLSLNDWLRVQPGLTGTKKMCNEGGCGCCVVTATINGSAMAINSVRIERMSVVCISSFIVDMCLVLVSSICCQWLEHYYCGRNRKVSLFLR